MIHNSAFFGFGSTFALKRFTFIHLVQKGIMIAEMQIYNIYSRSVIPTTPLILGKKKIVMSVLEFRVVPSDHNFLFKCLIFLKNFTEDFPGGTVVKNLPAGLPWWRSG